MKIQGEVNKMQRLVGSQKKTALGGDKNHKEECNKYSYNYMREKERVSTAHFSVKCLQEELTTYSLNCYPINTKQIHVKQEVSNQTSHIHTQKHKHGHRQHSLLLSFSEHSYYVLKISGKSWIWRYIGKVFFQHLEVS